jgi:hypothetical protein
MFQIAVAVRKGIPHIHEDLLPVVSVEATGVCIPIGKREVVLAADYSSPGRIWTAADIPELLSFRDKCILTGDLNAKHPFWSSAVLNPSNEKLLQLFDTNDFKISPPQYPNQYSPVGNGEYQNL